MVRALSVLSEGSKKVTVSGLWGEILKSVCRASILPHRVFHSGTHASDFDRTRSLFSPSITSRTCIALLTSTPDASRTFTVLDMPACNPRMSSLRQPSLHRSICLCRFPVM